MYYPPYLTTRRERIVWRLTIAWLRSKRLAPGGKSLAFRAKQLMADMKCKRDVLAHWVSYCLSIRPALFGKTWDRQLAEAAERARRDGITVAEILPPTHPFWN